MSLASTAYLSLPWPADAPPPKIELHACLALAGTGVLLLPILLAAACLKLGNLANDGIKLGRQLSTCSRDPSTSSLLNAANSDTGEFFFFLFSLRRRYNLDFFTFLKESREWIALKEALARDLKLINSAFVTQGWPTISGDTAARPRLSSTSARPCASCCRPYSWRLVSFTLDSCQKVSFRKKRKKKQATIRPYRQ